MSLRINALVRLAGPDHPARLVSVSVCLFACVCVCALTSQWQSSPAPQLSACRFA